jgi:hypothetical protein
MAPVTNPPSPIKRSTTFGGKLPELPQLSRKRPHPNDENVSPSSKNSPAKTNISSGLVSIRNYFLPASQVEEDLDCSAECPSPKKLRSSGSTTSVAPVSPAGTVSFITSTPKRTPIPLRRINGKYKDDYIHLPVKTPIHLIILV